MGKVVRSQPFWLFLIVFIALGVVTSALLQPTGNRGGLSNPQPLDTLPPGGVPRLAQSEVYTNSGPFPPSNAIPYSLSGSFDMTCCNVQGTNGCLCVCPTEEGPFPPVTSPPPTSPCSGACNPSTNPVPAPDPVAGFENMLAPSTNNPSGRPGAVPELLISGNSTIVGGSFEYVHSAWDLPSVAPGGFGLKRFFRSRSYTWRGSFGPGFFSNLDTFLTLECLDDEPTPASSWITVIQCFDPTSRFQRYFHRDHPTNQWTDKEHKATRRLVLLNSQGNVAAANEYPGTARIELFNGESFEFEIIDTGEATEYPQTYDHDGDDETPPVSFTSLYGRLYGRLIAIRDRNGRTVASINYKTWTNAELEEAPDRLWQIDTVTDLYGAVTSFEYLPDQIGGRWCVSEVTTSDDRTVTYSYDAQEARLESVTLPDGAVSSFDLTVDNSANRTVIEFHDPAATGTHRAKKAWLSNVVEPYYGQANSSAPLSWTEAAGESSGVVRAVVNGDDEVSYLGVGSPGHNNWYVYQGGGRMMLVGQYSGSRAVSLTGWELHSGGDLQELAYESTFPHYKTTTNWHHFRWGTPGLVREADGTIRNFEYDDDGFQTVVTYDDQTFETFCYNEFKQVTRYRDREGHVTRSTYDAHGNLLTKAVGLTDSVANTPPPPNPNNPYGDPSEGYNRCATDDVQTPEYALHQWEYYPETHANAWLLKTATDPNGNETDYEYDANHRLVKVTQPPDVPSGPRAETTYTYNTAGRLASVTDPVGRTTSYTYDARGRTTVVTYDDDSTDRYFYGANGSGDENLLVKSADRRGVVTNYEYDDSGRRTRTVHAAAVMDAAGTESPVSDPSVTVEETVTYLNGTNLPLTRTRAGELTEYTYDYRHRVASTTVHPNTETELTTTNTYVNNQLFKTTDPYGRSTFYAYDATDGRLIRSIQGTVPSVTYADYAAVLAALRDPDGTPNSTSLVTDYIYDAEGSLVRTVDPRGIEHHTEYDSRGRTVAQIQAAEFATGLPTPVQARTETAYDAASNVIEVRTPRYFDADDLKGFEKAKTTMTYTGRNLLATRTEAPGTPETATESYTYTLDGRRSVHTDFRGEDWETVYTACCARVQATIDPLGHGSITNHDAAGNVTHQVTVADVASVSNFNDPDNADTRSETTTRYDERGRPVARTVWTELRGAVDPQNPPIAGEDNIPATDGHTTRWTYDEDLDDNLGLDAEFADLLADLDLGTTADGSAVLVTNASGERTLSISDGAGRSLRSRQLDGQDDALTGGDGAFDALFALSGYGDLLETASANLLEDTTKRRTDAAGRTLQSVDAAGFISTVTYDASGNPLSNRDPNGVGQDCEYDALGRDVSCTDTASITTRSAYDLAGNKTQAIDAKNHTTYYVFDPRGRQVRLVDRLGGITEFTYDAAGNQLSMTDAEGQTTTYVYDDVGRRIQTIWPDHVAGSQAGDAGYGITTTEYDAAGRMSRTTDQLGDTLTYVYDPASRLIRIEGRIRVNSPSGATAFVDEYTYDPSGRLLTAHSGQYDNTVTRTYDAIGRLASESLTIAGQTYTVGLAYGVTTPVVTITYPDGSVVERTSNSRGLLAQIDRDATMIVQRAYDDGGRMIEQTFGNGIVEQYTWRTDNLPATWAMPGGTATYSYDANKNRTSESITGLLSGYSWTTGISGFDDGDRLVARNQGSGALNESWELSPVGDFESVTVNGSTTNRTHASLHKLASIASTPLQHDAKDNLTIDDEGHIYGWSMRNRLASVDIDDNGDPEATFAYDALDRKVLQVVNGSSVALVWVGYHLLAEYASSDPATSPTRDYISGPRADDWIAMSDRTDLGAQASGVGEYFWYHMDAAGHVRSISDAIGDFAELYCYGASGTPHVLDPVTLGQRTLSNAGNRFLFTGREWLFGLDVYDFRYRIYSPRVSRFITRDLLDYVNGPSCYRAYFVPNGLDPSGLLLVAIDGTGSRDFSDQEGFGKGDLQSAILNFREDYDGAGKYFPGPGGWYDEITGADCQSIEDDAYAWVCESWCSDKEPIDIVGHSRGGYIAMQLARKLASEGCTCCGAREIPPIRFVGLYDPVDMAPGYPDDDGGDGLAPGVSCWAFVVAASILKPDGSVGGRSRGEWRRPLPEGDRAKRLLPPGSHIRCRGSHSGIGGAPWQGDQPDGLTPDLDRNAAIDADQFIRNRAASCGVPVGSKDRSKYGYGAR